MAIRSARTILVLVVVAIMGAGCTKSASATDNPVHAMAPSKRKPAGAVEGKLIVSGVPYKLSADLGHVVVVNFFAKWCGPCQVETPQFEAVSEQRASSGIRFVGIDIKDGSESDSQDWLTSKGVTFPVLWDQPGRTALEIGHFTILGPPATVVIDKTGRVAWTHDGILEPADLSPILDQVQAGD